jgi:hypothetical protein
VSDEPESTEPAPLDDEERTDDQRLGDTLVYAASPSGKRERDVALLRSIGAIEPEQSDEQDWDGGARETAPPTNPDAEADHNQAIVDLLQQASQDRYGA